MERLVQHAELSQPTVHSCVVVHLSGELDVASAPDIRLHLTTLISDGCIRLVLNTVSLDFIDAGGIGSLVHVANRARAAGGWVRLIGVKPRHHRLLMIVRLGTVLPMYEDLAGALREA
jgi:anti-sigma B factor antagonist